jgi:Ca-activated chloride channel family protein
VSRRPLRAALAALALALSGCSADWWWTADQQGRRAYEGGDFAVAASAFEDPAWKGVAAYRAGDHEAAVAYFARLDTAEAWFNRGNALARLDRLEEAEAAYGEALTRHPGWLEAEANRALVAGILKRREEEQGEPGDPSLDADDTVVDERGKRGKAGEVKVEQLDAAALEALWLRRLETSPAGYLRRKFAIQAEEAGR